MHSLGPATALKVPGPHSTHCSAAPLSRSGWTRHDARKPEKPVDPSLWSSTRKNPVSAHWQTGSGGAGPLCRSSFRLALASHAASEHS
jgi:hypothetical protein